MNRGEHRMPVTPTHPGWIDAGDVHPTVLILGGFMAAPPFYRRLPDRLVRRGAAAVVIADVWTPDWMLSVRRGAGAIATRSARALLRASRVAGESSRSRGAPLLVIGHSAGGIIARILTSSAPFEGRRLGGADRIGAIVTLGTPHVVAPALTRRGEASARTSTFADEHVPGAYFAPGVGYVSVTSGRIVGRSEGNLRERAMFRVYRELLPGAGGTEIPGDGLIPVGCTLLEGSRHIVLDDAVHSPLTGAPWYGADPIIDEWWPAALESWRGALDARRGEGVRGDRRDDADSPGTGAAPQRSGRTSSS